MAHRRAFPKADSPLALDLWSLGKAAVIRYAELSREEVYQSLQAAALAHTMGVTLSQLLESPRTHLCGPRKTRTRTK